MCGHNKSPSVALLFALFRTNKTSNSIPSVIKGYLDRNINISLKSNQMLLHGGGAQDSEEVERKTEKQGRYFIRGSESVPRPQHFETFIPQFLCPPSPWPTHLARSRGISLRIKAAQPGFDSPPPITWGLERPVGEADSATARTGEEV